MSQARPAPPAVSVAAVTTARRPLLILALTLLAALLPTAAASPRTSPAAQPCFGAAARAVAPAPCSNPALRYTVYPSPEDALLQPSSACTLAATKGPPNRVCAFGTPKADATATVGLLGDSHAPAWRGAVERLTREEHWRGLTVRRSSCPFTFARRYVSPASAQACDDWVRAVILFFGHHPEIHTVFLVNSSAYDFVPAGGLDPHQTAVAGYEAAIAQLPASITHVVVIRDNPQATDATLPCIEEAMAHHHRADVRCALPRSQALRPDAPADAAAALASPRVRAIDLTPYFCDDTRCYAVVGGALVYKDQSHITTSFSASLGPYLAAAYRALGLPPA